MSKHDVLSCEKFVHRKNPYDNTFKLSSRHRCVWFFIDFYWFSLY